MEAILGFFRAIFLVFQKLHLICVKYLIAGDRRIQKFFQVAMKFIDFLIYFIGVLIGVFWWFCQEGTMFRVRVVQLRVVRLS